MNPYRWLWSRVGGRPWTYIWRDLWNQAEYLMHALWFFTGVGVFLWIGWRGILVWWLVYTYGYLNGHFFWGTRWIPGQRGD